MRILHINYQDQWYYLNEKNLSSLHVYFHEVWSTWIVEIKHDDYNFNGMIDCDDNISIENFFEKGAKNCLLYIEKQDDWFKNNQKQIIHDINEKLMQNSKNEETK